jgi:hypothetical protein
MWGDQDIPYVDGSVETINVQELWKRFYRIIAFGFDLDYHDKDNKEEMEWLQERADRKILEKLGEVMHEYELIKTEGRPGGVSWDGPCETISYNSKINLCTVTPEQMNMLIWAGLGDHEARKDLWKLLREKDAIIRVGSEL